MGGGTKYPGKIRVKSASDTHQDYLVALVSRGIPEIWPKVWPARLLELERTRDLHGKLRIVEELPPEEEKQAALPRERSEQEKKA
jgi:hypothetical protein